MSEPQVYRLPDTLRNWPWKRIISPHYRQAQAESVAWLESFHPFTPVAQRAFNKCDFSLVSALTFPNATLYNLRSCCDLMHTFFTLDEYTDPLDAAGVKALCDATMDAIENPDKPRPEGESVIGEIARQFWKRASVNVPKPCQERFVNAWRTYLASVVEQAERRSKAYICTVDEYMIARRNNIGSDPSFALLEISLGLDLPHEVMEHPAIVSLNRDTTDMIILANDMCSYKKEVLGNDADYNAVTVIMVNEKTDVAGGIQWISDRHDDIVDNFLTIRDDVLEHKNGVPSWGKDIDDQVVKYIEGLGQWIRGHDSWNFESGRYFGDKGVEIQQSRVVVIA
ncbi:terpenoid synthase [Mycena maculata]|uniref:Terpene synthase n=1 Tax=Mycena maculata TaxID=230809 RepID=A0AAD7NBH8_9AGAR|nr:terpenoid synthase [Mycena maculata]